jgi:two-component system alkaline phosphatase synthesis response regulator PhoP
MAEEVKTQYKIIIVDDDDFLVNMYATKFGNSGVAVEICKSGEALLEKLKAGTKADLILLDIVMPNMTGIEVLRRMRQDKLGEGIAVAMLTNQNDEKDISETKKLGVVCYIVKAAATPSEVVKEVISVIKNKN